MIPQLYPGHDDLDAEEALDRTLDGHFCVARAARRRAIDASPLGRWLKDWVMGYPVRAQDGTRRRPAGGSGRVDARTPVGVAAVAGLPPAGPAAVEGMNP